MVSDSEIYSKCVSPDNTGVVPNILIAVFVISEAVNKNSQGLHRIWVASQLDGI